MGTGAPVPRCPSPPSPAAGAPLPQTQQPGGEELFCFSAALKERKKGEKRKGRKKGCGGWGVCVRKLLREAASKLL